MAIPAEIFSFFFINYLYPVLENICYPAVNTGYFVDMHSAVTFSAIFFYDINTEPYSIKSISLINFSGSGDDVGGHKNTRKSNLVTRGVTTQPEMYTEDRSHAGYFSLLVLQIPPSTLSYSRSPVQKYDNIEASNIAIVREIMRIRRNMQ